MIAFGCATRSDQEYRSHAAPSIEKLAEADSLLMRKHGRDSIHEPYNEMLAQAARRDDLEALVLLHEDLAIGEKRFLDRVRSILAADRDVAIVGAAGARGVDGLAWWEGSPRGRVKSPALVPGGHVDAYSSGVHEVDSVDGMLLVLSPWAVRNLRFDADLSGPLDGYDLDVCLQARAHGRRVVAGDFEVSHFTTYDSFFDRRRWVQAAVAVQRKWATDLVPRHI